MERRRSSTLVFVLCAAGVAALGAASCASRPEVRTVLPPLEGGDTEPTAGYEAPPVLRASEILPADLVRGPHYVVDEEVRTDGFIHLYSISSDFGVFEAHGDDLLRVRVREIRALAALEQMSASKEFAASLARGLKSPFVATWNLVRHPVDSVRGIPVGAWRAVKRTSQLARGERGELEDSAFREFIGFEAKKRELAYQLGVDPYSSNRELQRELNRFAWVSFAGGMPFMLVPFVEEPAPVVDGETTASDRLAELLLHYSPEDLRRLNRIELAVMGIPESLSDAFLQQQWFSPRHQTVLVESLAVLDRTENRAALLEVALTAESEFDALFHQRVAQMIRAYHENAAAIRSLTAVGGYAAAYTADGTLVVPALVDHVVWTRPTAGFVDLLARAVREDPDAHRTELLLSGTLSSRARAEIEARGITVTDRAFERLGPDSIEARRGAR